jgi:hypothetical protein
MKEAEGSCERLIPFYQTTWCHNPEDNNLGCFFIAVVCILTGYTVDTEIIAAFFLGKWGVIFLSFCTKFGHFLVYSDAVSLVP